MEKISRAQFLDCLNHNWQAYIARFQQLSVEEKDAFLRKQGYRSFADLLAHICSWWQDGAQVVQCMRLDPALPLADYNVDEFNAQAVSKFNAFCEADVLQAYEAQRLAMVALVTDLSDGELYQTNINKRLYYEIMMHWTEHTLEYDKPRN